MQNAVSSFWTIILSIASSSIVSSYLAHMIWNAQKRKEFQWDYKKYILDKRKEAYEWVEQIIAESNALVNVPSYVVYKPFRDVKTLYNFVDLTAKNGHLHMWISQEMFDQIMTLNHYAAKINNDLGKTDHIVNRFAHDNFAAINDVTIKIKNQYFQDLKNLDNFETLDKKPFVPFPNPPKL